MIAGHRDFRTTQIYINLAEGSPPALDALWDGTSDSKD